MLLLILNLCFVLNLVQVSVGQEKPEGEVHLPDLWELVSLLDEPFQMTLVGSSSSKSNGAESTVMNVVYHKGNVYEGKNPKSRGDSPGRNLLPIRVNEEEAFSMYVNDDHPLKKCSCDSEGNCTLRAATKDGPTPPPDHMDLIIKSEKNYCRIHEFVSISFSYGTNKEYALLDIGSFEDIPSERKPLESDHQLKAVLFARLNSGSPNTFEYKMKLNQSKPIAIITLDHNNAFSVVAGEKRHQMVTIAKFPGLYDSIGLTYVTTLECACNINPFRLEQSPRGAKALNHMLLATGGGSVSSAPMRDYCFDFRPDAASINPEKWELTFYEGPYRLSIKMKAKSAKANFSEAFIDFPIKMPDLSWRFIKPGDDDGTEGIKRLVDAAVWTGQPHYTSLFFSGKTVLKIAYGLRSNGDCCTIDGTFQIESPLSGGPVDALWYSRIEDLLYAFQGEMFSAFKVQDIEVNKKAEPVQTGKIKDMFPQMKPPFDSVISVRIPAEDGSGVVLRSYFLARGYYFSITNEPETNKTDTMDELQFTLGDKGLMSGLEDCGKRYGLKDFSVDKHLEALHEFYSAWEPDGKYNGVKGSDMGKGDESMVGGGMEAVGIVGILLIVVLGIVVIIASYLVWKKASPLRTSKKAPDESKPARYESRDPDEIKTVKSNG